MDDLGMFMNGGITIGCVFATAFFLRFWRDTRDRFFLFFSAAFALMAINWIALATIAPAAQVRHYFYMIRLVAFVLILVAIVDKNRRTPPS
jgi:peptidoglycan/LPS O-acetylase OafA/YrhL